MNRQLVFVPIAESELDVLGGTPLGGDRRAYAVTPELLAELGYGPAEAEDAEYAALVLASVAGLAAYGVRLVVVAEVDPALLTVGADPANGEVVLAELPTGAITSWFTDEPGTDVTDAAASAKGLSIDECWELREVQTLLNGHDLLWNDVVEFRRRG